MWRNFPPRWRKGWREGNASWSGGGGSSFFAFVFVVICFLVGFLFLFVSLLLYFFCAVIIAKELIIDKDRLCGLQCSYTPPLPPQPPDSTLTLIANGLQNWVVFFLIFFNAPSAGGYILTRVNAREPQTFRLTARVRFFFLNFSLVFIEPSAGGFSLTRAKRTTPSFVLCLAVRAFFFFNWLRKTTDCFAV